MPDGTTYTPRPGSKAEAAIAILQREGWMSNIDLAAELDIEPRNLNSNITIAQREGLVRSVARNGVAGFALGGTGEPVPDGDVAVRAAAQARRPKLRKDQPAPKARQPRSKRRAAQTDESPRHTSNGGAGTGAAQRHRRRRHRRAGRRHRRHLRRRAPGRAHPARGRGADRGHGGAAAPVTPRAHVPVEALRYAWERSDWHVDVPFGRALADPVLGPLLRLGALIITRREPLDRKRLAAGEREEDFA